MKYEVVTIGEKTVVGIKARTNNTSPDMGKVIGGLWNQFYEEGIYAEIKNRVNDKALGIYTDYAGTEKEDYTVMVASEVMKAEEIPEKAVVMTIPAGRYAKFIVEGDMVQAVAAFWGELWKMDLDRSFICDFEEYQDGEMEHATIHIYVGIK